MAKKVKQTALQAAAAELNEVLGINPAMDVTLSDADLTPKVKKAIKLIDPEDEFSEETQAVIDSLKPAKKEEEAAPAKDKKADKKDGKKSKPAPEPDPEDEDEDEDDDDDEDEDEDEAPAKKAEPAKSAKSSKKDEPKKDAKEAKEAKKSPFVAAEYTRVDAVSEALKSKPKTVKDWVEKADALIGKHGGKPNPNEAKFIIRYVQKMAKHFDFGGVTVPQA